MNNLVSGQQKNQQIHLQVQLPKKESTIKAGSLLLSFKPFAFTLNSNLFNTNCDFCLSSNSRGNDAPLLRCGSCHVVKYCDRNCQKNGWTEGHKAECKGIKIHGRAPPSFARLLLRVIIKLQSKIDYCDQVTPTIFRRFRDLMSHYSDIKQDETRMEHIMTMGKVLESLLIHQKGYIMPNEMELIGICGRIMVNSFSISDPELQPLGTGIYLGASIFDHSCEPMAVATFESTTIYIRALVDYSSSLPIDKVTICYQDTLKPSIERIAELKRIYYFECQCERCSIQLNDEDMNAILCPNQNCRAQLNLNDVNKCPNCQEMIDEICLQKIKETEEMVKEKVNEMHSIAYLDVCEVCLRVMTSNHFSESHWLYASIVSSAFDASVNLQLWDKALFYGKLALKSYKRYLHPFHPFLGLALLKLAKLTWYMEKEIAARAYILEAKRILDITHGPTSTFIIREVLPLLRDIANYPMSWSLSRMARYVIQSKYLEKLKQNEELCLKAFDKGSFLLFCDGKPLLTASETVKGGLNISWSSIKDTHFCKDIKSSSVLLGIDEASEDDNALFACPVASEDVIGNRNARFSDMRRAVLSLPKKEATLVARGYSLLMWNERMKYCPSCASPMNGSVSGTVRKCSKSCGLWKEHYPVCHPVSIVRVTDPSDEKVLLVRQPRHPKGMYSCIAGFMEPGESAEETVRREIAEEVGIVVEKIAYFDSQTWPLPQNSLMLAFTAVAMSGSEKVDIDTYELEEAKWFTKDEVKMAYERVTTTPGIMVKNENGDFYIPPAGAIAHDLLKSWIGL